MSEDPSDAVDEITALEDLARALNGFDRETCKRMLDWAADRYAGCKLVQVREIKEAAGDE